MDPLKISCYKGIKDCIMRSHSQSCIHKISALSLHRLHALKGFKVDAIRQVYLTKQAYHLFHDDYQCVGVYGSYC